MKSMVGVEELETTPWTDATFEKALEADLPHLDDPSHVRSAEKVLAVFGDHLVRLRVAGQAEELPRFTRMLHELLTRHPELPRIGDLDPPHQIGVRLEMLFEALDAAEQVPTTESARTILMGASPGNVARLRILSELVRSGGSLTAPDLAGLIDAKSRQHVHQLLERLRQAALITTNRASTPHTHIATPLGIRAVRELVKKERPLLLNLTIKPAQNIKPQILTAA